MLKILLGGTLNEKAFMVNFCGVIDFLLVACNSDTADNEDSSTTNSAEQGENETTETAASSAPIKVGVLASLTGALESYGKQTKNGFELGLEYATDGTMEVEE